VTNEFKYGMIEFRTYETVKPCGLLNIASTIFWVKNQKVQLHKPFLDPGSSRVTVTPPV
jgi:hypothetical protein